MEKNGEAKMELQSKITKLIKDTNKEIEAIKFQTKVYVNPDDKEMKLSFISDDKKPIYFKDWLSNHIDSFHVKQVGSDLWNCNMVQMIDYIANPRIEKKNFKILEELVSEYLPQLEAKNNGNVFKEVINKLKKLED